MAAEPPKRLNVWSLIKDWVGKDITRLSVPVYINEPLCELQRRAEGFEHSYLLDEVHTPPLGVTTVVVFNCHLTHAPVSQAAEMPAQSQDRLLAIAAYAVSICCTIRRTTKPFKDLQNATYELVYPERGYRLVGEKVHRSPAWCAYSGHSCLGCQKGGVGCVGSAHSGHALHDVRRAPLALHGLG